MVVILLKLVFLVVTTISNLVSQLIFTATAHVLVQLIQALRGPEERSRWILEQARSAIQWLLDYLTDIVITALLSVLSSVSDLVKEGVVSASSGLTWAVMELGEKLKTSLDQVVEDVPDVINAFADMVGKIAADLSNNCVEAVKHVMENVLN